MRDFRKHVAWYLKGFPVGSEIRRALAMVSSLAELDDLLDRSTTSRSRSQSSAPRGRTTAPRRVVLPEGWLADRDDPTLPFGAELEVSGG